MLRRRAFTALLVAALSTLFIRSVRADPRVDEIGRIKTQLHALHARLGQAEADKQQANAAHAAALKDAAAEPDLKKKQALDARAAAELKRMRGDAAAEQRTHRQIAALEKRRNVLEAELQKEQGRKPQ